MTISLVREPAALLTGVEAARADLNMFWLFNSGLTYFDAQGVLHPMTAERVPMLANGDWVLNPDGTMVTTYRLRENARWHDGARLTPSDFAFALQVYSDPEVPIRSYAARVKQTLAAVETVDDRTVSIKWSTPYAYANILGPEFTPLPRHYLEEKYRASKADFTTGDEWNVSYVGTGPFRVDRWERGVQIVARAFPDWVLGTPRIETLNVRFIADRNTLLANLLAGDLDVAASPSIRLSQALVARDQWAATGEGYLKTWESRFNFLELQYQEVPNWQPAITDRRVRQALLHSIDRDALAEVMTEGLGRKADAWIGVGDPFFPEVDRAITKYPFDPQRALSLLAEAGARRPGY